MSSPFRDENASLRAENERLRAARGGPGRSKLWLGLLFVGADFGLAMTLRPWLNGGDDLHFWLALGLLAPLGLLAVWAVARR